MDKKYLKEIHAKETTCLFNTDEKDKARDKKFSKQRGKWRFDERETWDMCFTSADWLYSHLKMYLDVCIADLEFRKFKVPVLAKIPGELLSYPGGWDYPDRYYVPEYREMTQGEAVRLCMKYLRYYFKHGGSFDTEKEARADEKLQAAFHIYATIAPAMWW